MSHRTILHVIFSSRLAGSERYCADLANRQAEEGHEVHVAGRNTGAIRGALSDKVHFHGFNWFLRGLRLRRLVQRLAPDVCHGHLSAACKALRGVPSSQRTVATLHVGYKAHQHAWLDGLICVNRAQAGRLNGYKGVAQTIPNWMPLAPAPAPSTGGIRRELGISKKTFLVGAVGRLHPSKGMDVLISAFRASAPAEAALVIIGEGPQRADLERLCAGDSRIHLPGFRSAVHDCLRDMDLFVSPSREESFGLAIIEAMSTGAPIIATAAEGPGEFLLDHPVSLIAPGSTDALATEIGHAFQQYAKGNLRRIEYDLGMFDPSARVANIMDFYGQVIEAGQWSPARRPAARVAFAT